MSNTFFTSDTHWGHKKIIEYSKRPFKSVEEMNETLISNWNDVVKPGDTIYHLGDFGFVKAEENEKILRRLNGQKFLIFGNHDKKLRKQNELLRKYFGWAKDYAEIKVDEQLIILSHYSFRVWNKSHYASWNLYGHSHGTLYDDPKMLSMDVGVDPNGYYPVSFKEVQALMKKKKWEPIDHHNGK